MEASKPKIAVVVPTIRPEHFRTFLYAWYPLFKTHCADLFVVRDGDDPEVLHLSVGPSVAYDCYQQFLLDSGSKRSSLPEDEQELFSDHNPACRNLGFYVAASSMTKFDMFLTLDDDCLPIAKTDPIADHIEALGRRWPLSWMSTTDHKLYMRGFPYGVRAEAEAIVSHGLWSNNPDFDAPSELTYGDVLRRNNLRLEVGNHWFKGPIPRGVFAPICGMHVAFKREALPHYYHCPVESFPGAERFDDIWMGLNLKKQIDAMPGKCIVSGCAVVEHTRASNPFVNLEREAVGIKINETLWKGEVDAQYEPFFTMYHDRRERYAELLKPLV